MGLPKARNQRHLLIEFGCGMTPASVFSTKNKSTKQYAIMIHDFRLHCNSVVVRCLVELFRLQVSASCLCWPFKPQDVQLPLQLLIICNVEACKAKGNLDQCVWLI